MTRRRARANGQRRPPDRRPGFTPGRRFALVLVLAGAFLGYSAPIGGADSSAPLVSATVYSASGTTTGSVSVAQLQASSQCPVYGGPNVMDEMGRQGSVDVPLSQSDTWALSTILGCLEPNPVPIPSVQGVTVMNADGTPETDSGSQIASADLKPLGQTDFNNPDEGPVVTALGTSNRYDRPWRGSSQGQPDYDFSDQVTTNSPNGQAMPVEIEVFEGPLLTVTVTASETTVPAGATVTFGATVTGQNGSALSYSWNFDGGATNSTSAAPQVTFGSIGQYNVTVQVADAQGGGGVASIPITVGTSPAPATGGHKQKGAGKNKKSQSPTGPSKSSGTHAGARPGKQKTSQSTTSGKNTTAKSSATNESNTATTPAPTNTSTDPVSPSTPTNPSTAHRPTTSGRRTTGRSPVRPVTPPPQSGSTVVGLLVSDVTPLPPAVSPLVRTVPTATATAPPARQAVRASLVPAFATGFVVLLLFGLGAGRELRGRR